MFRSGSELRPSAPTPASRGSLGGFASDGPLVYVDHSEARAGKLAQVRDTVAALVDFVEWREPRLLFYGFYLDSEASTMAVVAVHPDSASLKFHLQIGGPEFRKVGEFIDLRLIEVYGEPSPPVRQLLPEKAVMLARDATVVVHERSVRFANGVRRFLSRAGS